VELEAEPGILPAGAWVSVSGAATEGVAPLVALASERGETSSGRELNGPARAGSAGPRGADRLWVPGACGERAECPACVASESAVPAASPLRGRPPDAEVPAEGEEAAGCTPAGEAAPKPPGRSTETFPTGESGEETSRPAPGRSTETSPTGDEMPPSTPTVGEASETVARGVESETGSGLGPVFTPALASRSPTEALVSAERRCISAAEGPAGVSASSTLLVSSEVSTRAEESA
jgi:hypothetical protein